MIVVVVVVVITEREWGVMAAGLDTTARERK